MRRVVVTGMGCVTPVGNDVPSFWESLKAGKCGIGPITPMCIRDRKKTARLQKIAREAARQGGRGIMPAVEEPRPLKQALEEAARQGEILFFYERGQESLKQALQTAGGRLFVFVGPEGGFAPEEAALDQSLGAKLLTLGPRILRTETARCV